MKSPDFYLRYDVDSRPNVTDTTVRRCFIRRSLRVDTGGPGNREDTLFAAGLPQKVLHIAVDPPLPMMGKDEVEVMLGDVYWGNTVYTPKDRLFSVMVHRVRDWSAVSRQSVAMEALHRWRPADLARTPQQLPRTREQNFQEGLEHLRQFVAREGHTDVPELFEEDGYSLGIWVQNTRRTGRREDESAQLAAIPEWRWLSSEETELLRAYAKREGHTDPPDTYVVDHLALENLVQQVRTQHARGLVSPDEVQRLEQIPYWHW